MADRPQGIPASNAKELMGGRFYLLARDCLLFDCFSLLTIKLGAVAIAGSLCGVGLIWSDCQCFLHKDS